MIAQRFRPVVWVSGVATAATLLYIVSLQVATERGRLEEVDRQVSATRREIRQLQTELGTRASLRQLERWNGDVLSLSAPKASQYVSSEDQISTISRKNMGDVAAAPPPVMAAVLAAEPKPAGTVTVSEVGQGPMRSAPKDASPVSRGSETLASRAERQVQQAFASVQPKSDKPVKVAANDKPTKLSVALPSKDKEAKASSASGGKVNK